MKLLCKLAFLVGLILFAGRAVQAADAKALVCIGGTVYPSPTAAPVERAVLLVRDGVIETVADSRVIRYAVPPNAQTIDCRGKFIVAGFWNSHVHFTEDAWNDADKAPADKLEAHMQKMLTRWGFTTVWDIGSFPQNTLPLRHRVDSGEVPGPKIFTTAGSIFPENGIPVYLPEEIARQLKPQEAATPEDAARLARQSLQLGGDGIKLFAGAIKGHGKVVPMDLAIVKAAVEVTHAAGKPVFAHPSNHVGTDNALAGGVDVLAHLIPMESDWTHDELVRMKQQKTAVIPTLAMFMDEERKFGGDEDEKRMVMERSQRQMKEFLGQGGTVLFGTDVGYTQLYDTASEYEYMGRAMGWKDILASLTTNPATFFKAANEGRVEKGMNADFVVLDGDPAVDVRNFAKVKYTVRGGRVIYEEK